MAVKRGKSFARGRIDQANLAGNIDSLGDWANGKLNVRQPGAAVARPEYQTPAVKAALNDIADAPDRLGKNPSIQSMRNLRTEFWEKGNDYSGNIPDSARALYKQAAARVDDEIMKAATGTPFEDSFRDASGQWKELQQKFNEPGSVFYKILQQKDPTRIVSSLQHAPATDIAAIKAEGMDAALEPLRRHVLRDISSTGFSVRGGELGGYSDAYLRELFGPDTTKELYVKGDLAHRIKYNANPSGTGGNISAVSQILGEPGLKSQVKAGISARLSMPRDPLSFLPAPGASSAAPAIRTTPFAPLPGATPPRLPVRTALGTAAGASNENQ